MQDLFCFVLCFYYLSDWRWIKKKTKNKQLTNLSSQFSFPVILLICWCFFFFFLNTSVTLVFFSARWADVFSAKGCKDAPEHKFSHPFVQVQYKNYWHILIYHRTEQIVSVSSIRLSVSYEILGQGPCKVFKCIKVGFLQFVLMTLAIFFFQANFLPSYCVFVILRTPCAGSGHVSGGVQLSGRLLYATLARQTKTRTQDEHGSKLQPASLFPTCHVRHDSHLYYVYW